MSRSARAVWDDVAGRLRGLPRRRSRREDLRSAAVLVPLFWRGEGLHLVLTRRPDTLQPHPGQVAFPGGKLAPGETPLAGALREAEEELAIAPATVEPLGALHDVEVVTGYVVTPWVARIPADTELVPDPREVARVFTVPLADLVDPARCRFEMRPFEHGGRTYPIPFFHWEDETIWGATGRVLHDLLRLVDPDCRNGPV